MKILAFWERGPLSRAHGLRAQGATIIAWSAGAAGALRSAGIPCSTLGEILDPEAVDAIDEIAMAWAKNFGRRPLLDGRSLRELLAWRGVSLWWFAELYLYHCTRSPRRVRLIETVGRWLTRERPDEIEAVGLADEDCVIVERTCTARGFLFPRRSRAKALRRRCKVARISLLSRFNTLLTLGSAAKTFLARQPARPARIDVLFLSHAAFWRTREGPGDAREHYEHYFDSIIPEAERTAGLSAFVLAVGPHAAHRRQGRFGRFTEWLRLDGGNASFESIARHTNRRVVSSVMQATREIRQAWRRLRTAAGLQDGFSHAGVRFSDLAAPDLAGILLLQLPWAVRCIEEMSAALNSMNPSVVCLYAESSGWGRAALTACRLAGTPTVALQHGIIYPKYFSYRHDPDESDCPRPDRTAVFGEDARRLLIERGRYDPASLVITGSPKFDALLETARAWNRDDLRAELGLGLKERLVLVASRFREIRDTHRAIGPEFPTLVKAIEALPDLIGVVQPHPAELPAPYEDVLRELGARKIRMASAQADLVRLIHAADVLVTVESLTAIEALVLERPILILNMPSHLRQLVDQGVALGARAGEDPTSILRSLLFDASTGEALAQARRRYLNDFARGIDGGATRRIVEVIAETARGPKA